MQSPQEDYSFKILLIGAQEVGKSSIMQKFCNNSYSEDYLTTIGVDFRMHYLDLQGKKVKLQIWDTAGQERFKTIVSSYYKGAHGIILTYDITNKSSFEQLKTLLTEVENHASENFVLLLVGNKTDLETERKVTFEEGKAFADSLGIKFVECSAKSNTNLDEVFMTLAENIKAKQILLIPE